jgi:ArsR family transcriptional regulator
MKTTTPLDLGSIARRHQALADPTRLQILETLASGEQCVCDMTSALRTGQSRLSFHLKSLREAGFIKARRSGRWVYYSIDPSGIADARSYLEELTERAESGSVTTVEGCGLDPECCE